MHDFQRQGKNLYCEGIPLEALAQQYGTPLYVYSRATLERHFRVFNQAFTDIDHLICFAVKANSNLALLNLLSHLGSGADIVSGGELYRAVKAGIPGKRIVYSGVGKTIREMEQALDADILMFNIESFQELQQLNAVAARRGTRARISLRVNPDVNPETHPYVATGLKTSKFGITFSNALSVYEQAAALPHIQVVGVACHIGSQLTKLSPFIDSVRRLLALIANLRRKGMDIQYLDLGGGLGITYNAEAPPSPDEYATAIQKELAGEEVTLILEPGRNLAGNAGILLSRVLYVKETEAKRFFIVDAGMSDLLRPSLYNSYHGITPVVEQDRPTVTADVVGPICETGDFIARDREMKELAQDELIAVMSAGAYGFSMASMYNSRPLAAEVLVDGDKSHLIRERGTYETLIEGEHIPQL